MTDPTTAMRAAREALHALTDRDFTYLGGSVIEASRPLTLTWDEVWRAREAIAQLDAALAQPSDDVRDAARWAYVRDAYDSVKRSRGRNALDALGIEGDECDLFVNIVDAALQVKDGAR